MSSISTLERQKSGVIPPWLWFWLVWYLTTVPFLITEWHEEFKRVFFHQGAYAISQRVELPFAQVYAPELTNLLEQSLALSLFLGVLSIFIPQIRRVYIECQYCLKEPDLSNDSQREISEFIHNYAPNLQIKTNLEPRFIQPALVYPLGYHKTGIAILSPLLFIWRKNRTQAEAILLHEIGHYRHGDAFIIGAGSLFRGLVKSWLLLYIILALIPLLIAFFSQIMASYQEFMAQKQLQDSILQTTREVDQLLRDLGKNIQLPTYKPITVRDWFMFEMTQILSIGIPGLLSSSFTLLFIALNTFILPLSAIWCAELNADRFVVDVQKSADNLLQALENIKKKSIKFSLCKWFLLVTSEPPIQLRSWMARQSKRMLWLILLLMLFPLAYFVKLLILSGLLTNIYLTSNMIGATNKDIVKELSLNVNNYWHSKAPVFLSMGALFVFWPVVAGYWEQFFSAVERVKGDNYKAYFVAAIIVIAIYIIIVKVL